VEILRRRSAFRYFGSLWIDDYPIDPKKVSTYEVINVDMYRASGGHTLAAEAAASCRHAGKKLVLFIVFDRLVQGMRVIQADQQSFQRFSRNVREYGRTSHSLDQTPPQLNTCNSDVLPGVTSSPQ